MRYLFLVLIAIVSVSTLLGCGCEETVKDSPKEELALEESSETQESESSQADDTKQVNLPLTKAEKRITKKPFGIYITPSNSSISPEPSGSGRRPERFSGYHNGIDYEIFDSEINTTVNVYAIRAGKILQKKNVSGYGGVVVQECKLDGQSVTVLYGHLKLSEVKKSVGDSLKKGEEFTVLGDAFSIETDFERKHLHLGIHKGSKINLRGYVGSESQLGDWVDFVDYY